jgi:protein gp37
MAATTSIEWADATANFWEGCTQVSPACDFCYAKERAARYGTVEWNGPPRKVEAGRKVARSMQRHAEATGKTPLVFVNSLSDFFDKLALPAWRSEALRAMESAPDVIFLLLTKRIGNVPDMLHAAGYPKLPRNVRLGITVVNQPEADRDVPKLLAVKAHFGIAWVFVSVEPMLGAIDFNALDDGPIAPEWNLNALTGLRENPFGATVERRFGTKLDWVICGGESGPKARPMHPDWARALRDQCAAAGVPFHFKQWGEWAEANPGPDHTLEIVETGGRNRTPKPGAFGSPLEKGDALIAPDGHTVFDFDAMRDEVKYRRMIRLGKARAGRLLDGIEHNARPPLSTEQGEARLPATGTASPGRSAL